MSKQLTLTDFDAVIGLYNGATRYCDACKNLNCLVPRCDDRDVSRGRARDHVNPVLRLTGQLETRFLSVTWLVVRITWWLIVIHMVEIALWALFFWWQKCLPDVESSFYFSGVTYATIGYGDLVLPKEWRLFGPLEGLTGILLCGLSTAFLFATLSRMYADRTNTNRN